MTDDIDAMTPRQRTAFVAAKELGKLQRGMSVSYEQLEEWTGRDVRKDRGLVDLIQQRLGSRYQMILKNVKGLGYRILHSDEHVEWVRDMTGKSERLNERRHVKAVIALREWTDVDDLSPDAQAEVSLAITHYAQKSRELRAFNSGELTRRARMLEGYGVGS